MVEQERKEKKIEKKKIEKKTVIKTKTIKRPFQVLGKHINICFAKKNQFSWFFLKPCEKQIRETEGKKFQGCELR